MQAEKLGYNEAEEIATEVKKGARSNALDEIGFDAEEKRELLKGEEDDSFVKKEHYEKASHDYLEKQKEEEDRRAAEKARQKNSEEPKTPKTPEVPKETEWARKCREYNKEKECRERRDLEKRRRKLPSIGEIFKECNLSEGKYGDLIITIENSLVGRIEDKEKISDAKRIIKDTDWVITEIRSRLEKMNDGSDVRKKYGNLMPDVPKCGPIRVDVEIASHAENARSVGCKVLRIYNLAEAKERLRELKKVLKDLDEKGPGEYELEQKQWADNEAREKKERRNKIIEIYKRVASDFDLQFPEIKDGEVVVGEIETEHSFVDEWELRAYLYYSMWASPIPKSGVEYEDIKRAILKKAEEFRQGIFVEGYVAKSIIDGILSKNFKKLEWELSDEAKEDVKKEDEAGNIDYFIEPEGDDNRIIVDKAIATYVLKDGSLPDWVK